MGKHANAYRLQHLDSYRRLRFEQMESRLPLSASGLEVPLTELEDALGLVPSDVSDQITRSAETILPVSDATSAADETIVTIDAVVLDASGQRPTQLQEGQQYTLQVFVQDTRESADPLKAGVYFAYVDVFLSANLIPSSQIDFPGDLSQLQHQGTLKTSNDSSVNVIEDVGAVQAFLAAPGQVRQLLFETTFTVEGESDNTFIHVASSRANIEPLGVHGLDYIVPAENVATATWRPSGSLEPVEFPIQSEVPQSETPTPVDPQQPTEPPEPNRQIPEIRLDDETHTTAIKVLYLLEIGTPLEEIPGVLAENGIEPDAHLVAFLDAANTVRVERQSPPDEVASTQLSAAIRSEVRDASGSLVTELEVGQEYSLLIYVQDTRSLSQAFGSTQARGVFAAYLDVFFSDNITPIGQAEFSNDFQAAQRSGALDSNATSNGVWIRNIGALGPIPTDGRGVGDAEQFLLATPFRVESGGSDAVIQVLPAQDNPEPLLLYGADDIVPNSNVVPASLNLAPVPSVPVDSPSIISEPFDPLPPSQPIEVPPITNVPIEPIENSDTPVASDEDDEVVFVSLTTDSPLDLPEPSPRLKVDGFRPNLVPLPESTRSLLQPFFQLNDPTFEDSIELPNVFEDGEDEEDKPDDGLIELAPPDVVPARPKWQAESKSAEDADKESEQQVELLEDFWSEALQADLLEPLASAFRLRMRLYSLDPAPESSNSAANSPVVQVPSAHQDGMIDLAEILRPSPNRQGPIFDSRQRFHSDAVVQHESTTMQGLRGSAMTFDLDRATKDPQQPIVDRQLADPPPRSSSVLDDRATAKDPPRTE